ncbi:transposase [Luteolibacter yonseiensis]|uniref:transposase n=1 Tax=Luteolibacter yonseiensis TaxID=1144680 RepID=UPI002D7E3E05|nr:transposase [Luteolibacter yonseiensis]
MSERAYFHRKKKYGGMDVSKATRLKALEEENSRLKRLVADQALDIQILKEVNSKKVVSPVQKKTVIETLVSAGSCGVARACRLSCLARSAVYRRAMPDAS